MPTTLECRIKNGEPVTCYFGVYTDPRIMVLHNPESTRPVVVVCVGLRDWDFAFVTEWDKLYPFEDASEPPTLTYAERLDPWWPRYALEALDPEQIRVHTGQTPPTFLSALMTALHG